MGSVLAEILRDSVLRRIKHKGVEFIVDAPLPAKKKYRISVCTTCMNRAADVKRTLPQNIEDNKDYGNVEFVLLNYNSKDDLGDWVRENMIDYIESGILNYYHTTEPEHYSMTHSRNVAFMLAQGDIVNNVDGDHYTNKGFVEHVNLLANQGYDYPMFMKGRQKNRGRIGLFKRHFKWLGGYDEDIKDYGFDDEDLRLRALALGFTFLCYGGKYFRKTDDHMRHQGGNYKNPNWKHTQRLNTMVSLINIYSGKYVANRKRHWGKAKVTKNFKEEMEI